MYDELNEPVDPQAAPLFSDDPEAARAYWGPILRYEAGVDSLDELDARIQSIDSYSQDSTSWGPDDVDLCFNPPGFEGYIPNDYDMDDVVRACNDMSRLADTSDERASLIALSERWCPDGQHPDDDVNTPTARAFADGVKLFWESRRLRQPRLDVRLRTRVGVQRVRRADCGRRPRPGRRRTASSSRAGPSDSAGRGEPGEPAQLAARQHRRCSSEELT